MADGRHEKSFIVPALGGAADWFNRNWLMRWLACVFPSLKDPSAAATERYVVGWFVFGLVISFAVCLLYDCVPAVSWLVSLLKAIIYLVAALRVVGIIARTTIVDFSDVISSPRSLILVAINYVELMLWFGLVYALNYHSLVDQSLADHSAPPGPSPPSTSASSLN